MEGFFQAYLSLYRPLISKLNALLAEFELSYSLWQVIFYVEKHGTSQLSAISVYFNIERPSVTRAVHRLEEKGLVEHVPGKDRREKSIQLTSHGETVYHECRARIIELEDSVVSAIPKETLQTAVDVFPQLREQLLTRKKDQNGKN